MSKRLQINQGPHQGFWFDLPDDARVVHHPETRSVTVVSGGGPFLSEHHLAGWSDVTGFEIEEKK